MESISFPTLFFKTYNMNNFILSMYQAKNGLIFITSKMGHTALDITQITNLHLDLRKLEDFNLNDFENKYKVKFSNL